MELLEKDRIAAIAWVMSKLRDDPSLQVAHWDRSHPSMLDKPFIYDRSVASWYWGSNNYWPVSSLVATLKRLDLEQPLCLYYGSGAIASSVDEVRLIRVDEQGNIHRCVGLPGADPSWRVDDRKRGYPRNGSMIQLTAAERAVGRWWLGVAGSSFLVADGRVYVQDHNGCIMSLLDGSTVPFGNVRHRVESSVIANLVEED